jgi:transcription antitermination factor NusG
MLTPEWYALHVRPRFERIVAFHLKKQNLEHYVPLRRVTRQSSLCFTELPLLPGYVFCSLPASERRALEMVPGVLNVLGTPADSATLEPTVLDLKRIIDNGFNAEEWPFMPAGRKVTVQAGTLKGIRGVLHTELPHQRVLVFSIGLIHRSVGVRLERDIILSFTAGMSSAA